MGKPPTVDSDGDPGWHLRKTGMNLGRVPRIDIAVTDRTELLPRSQRTDRDWRQNLMTAVSVANKT